MPSARTPAECVASSDPTAAAELNYLQTVPRQLVHRAAVAEVFLMDALQLDRDRFLVAAQWPRDHALYCPDRTGLSDPLLFAETIRQALVYLAHRFHGVALTHRFVGCEVEFDILDPQPLRVGRQPLAPVLEARWTWLAGRPPQRYEMRLDVELFIEGRLCGRGAMRVVCVDQRRYELIRWRGVGSGEGTGSGAGGHSGVTFTRLAPGEVGRLRTKDSLLERGVGIGRGADGCGEDGRGADAWQMRADPGHPILFDHPSDHIPMMVALEGVRQLGHVLAHRPALPDPDVAWSLRSARMQCLAFGDLDEPVALEIEENRPGGARDPARVMRVRADQRGRTAAVTTMAWRPEERSDAEWA